MAGTDSGRINFQIALDNTRLQRDAARSQTLLAGIGDKAVAEGNRMEAAMKKVGAAVAGMFAAGQLKQFATQVTQVRGQFQQLEIAFKTMIGSEEQAAALMSQLTESAAITPFNMSDIAQAAKQLLAYGVAAEDVNDTLLRLGDIAAGLSIPIGDLAYLYGTTMVQGRMYTQDLNQFLGRGIPIMESLAEQFGVTKDKVKDLVTEGKVGFPEVKKAIEDLTSEGSKFGGLMAEQSKSFTGQISNIEDSIEQMFNKIGQQGEGVINTMLSGVSTLVDAWETIGKVLIEIVVTVGSYKAAVIAVNAVQKIYNMLLAEAALQTKLAAAQGIVLSQAQAMAAARTTLLKSAFAGLNTVMKANPIGLVVSVVMAAVTAFALWKNGIKGVDEATRASRDAYEQAAAELSVYQARIKDVQKQKGDEKRLVGELNQKYGDSMGQYKTLNKWYAVLSKSGKEYCQVLANQIQLQEYATQLAKLQTQRTDVEEKMKTANRNPTRYVTTGGAVAPVGQQPKSDWQVLNEQLQSIDAQIDSINEKSSKLTVTMSPTSAPTASTSTTTDSGKATKDEASKRKRQIAEYRDDVTQDIIDAELDIRQAQIEAMDDGLDKTLAQNKLNYDQLKNENAKREHEMIDALGRSGATGKTEGLTRSDLTSEQLAVLKQYDAVAEEYIVRANREALQSSLEDVRTYEQKRTAITEEYAKKRAALYEDGDTGGTLRQGVEQGNVDELDRQETEALQAVDEQFAQREDTYRSWCNSIADYTLEQLEEVLARAQDELEAVEGGEAGGDSQKIATARAKVTTLRSKVSKARADVEYDEGETPDEDAEEQWRALASAVGDAAGEFETLGEQIGGTVGDALSVAGQVASTAATVINSISTLTQSAAAGMTATAVAAAAAISTIEKASVILTIISAAIQLATMVVNLFNDDDDKQEEIENLQERIDQLQWELDNAESVRLKNSGLDALQLIKDALKEQRVLLAQNAEAVGALADAYSYLRSKVSDDAALMAATVEEIAAAYANVSYSANKAIGSVKYSEAKEQLENIAQQQLLIQEQIEAEQSKKDSDSSQISEWEQEIEELAAEAVEIINEMVEDIIGGSSDDIAQELSDAFFEAFENGTDYAEAWGDAVDEILADMVKNLLIAEFLEEPLAELFDKYKALWYTDGTFAGLDTIYDSLDDLKADLTEIGENWIDIFEALDDELADILETTIERSGSTGGIASASQESIDELNGRATVIQSHTYSINECTKSLLASTNSILKSVLAIESNTDRLATVEAYTLDVRNTLNEMQLQGIKIK